jgi:hypothetical protein
MKVCRRKAVQYPGTTFIVPKGVFALDSPMDQGVNTAKTN